MGRDASNPSDSTAGKITLYGCGRMGSAMLAGWLKGGFDAASLQVIEPNPSQDLLDFAADRGVPLVTIEKAGSASVLLLAVKPQVIGDIAANAGHIVNSDTLVVSIMAGTTIDRIRDLFPAAGSIVRTMPNLAALVGKGTTVLVAEAATPKEHSLFAARLMSAVGDTHWLSREDLIDAAVAVSGSGPAYFFYLAEVLAKAGEAEGLPADVALLLAQGTLVGAGALLDGTGRTAEELRHQVTSPAGTTEAGLSKLIGGDALARPVAEAVTAASARSRELGGSQKKDNAS